MRNLPNRNLNLRDEYLAARATHDLFRRSAFEEKFNRLAQVIAGLLDGVALAGDIQFRAERDEPVPLALNYGGKLLGHEIRLVVFGAQRPIIAVDQWIERMTSSGAP